MTENITIKKAKIVDELFLDVEFTEKLPNHADKKTKLSCTVPIHEDLKASFDKLHKHLAILCDEVTVSKKDRIEQLEYPTFGARSFSIGGSEDSSGVTISGYKEGKYGMVNLNTPFAKYAGSDYPFESELAIDVESCIYEIEQYLFNGKQAPEQQISMEFPDDETNQ